MELAALSRSAAEQRCRELGLATTGTGRDCRQRLADYFSHAPREVIPITPKAASLKLYKRALWVLDHIPWEKITTKATGSKHLPWAHRWGVGRIPRHHQKKSMTR
jgi:hypothetical protein